MLAQAQQYVIGTPSARGGATAVFFDAGALGRDIAAAGRTVWGGERPVLLVVLTGGPLPAHSNPASRWEAPWTPPGIVVVNRSTSCIPRLSTCRPPGTSLTDAALAAAQRARADAVLVGYGDAVPTGGTWRWALTAQGVGETWNGTLEEGVHGAADVFARNAAVFAATPDLAVLVEIEGVLTLKEYVSAAARSPTPRACAASSWRKRRARAARSAW